ncbi:MAG: tetratricopeptide repeat protein [Candidatus Omnitrophica bacterium]|nr:tetratricopeptide repeat protein [Candidatus Omnitrophota bacterium]
MKIIPSIKFLLSVFLLIVISGFLSNHLCQANLIEQAEEYLVRANRFQGEGKIEQAIVCYQKTIGIDKHCLAAYNGLAICYEQQGLLSQAEQCYQQALEINPNYAAAHYNLGLLYERRGQIKQAIFHWKKRLSLGHPAEPGRIKAQAKLKQYDPEQLQQVQAQELNQQITQEKEEGALDKLLGRNRYQTKEEKIQEYYMQGMQAYQEGDYPGAQEYFQKMIDALPHQ